MARYVLEFEKPLFELEKKLEALKRVAPSDRVELTQEISYLEGQLEKLRQKIYSKLSPWEKVQMARHPDRPRTLDYVDFLFTGFLELHGDRLFRDDPAVIGGLAYFEQQKVMIVGHQKGKSVKENVMRNFGMPHPEGIRKAFRLMKLAEKFELPIFCFIDTPGAYPGVGAEERGQGAAIATNLMEISALATPIIITNIGEGGSGGALAFGIGDKICILENAYYSVISPEGCASILWRDESRAPEAAEALKLTADALLELGVVDDIVKEPLGGAHHNPAAVAQELKNIFSGALQNLKRFSKAELLQRRYERLRKIGSFKKSVKRAPKNPR